MRLLFALTFIFTLTVCKSDTGAPAKVTVDATKLSDVESELLAKWQADRDNRNIVTEITGEHGHDEKDHGKPGHVHKTTHKSLKGEPNYYLNIPGYGIERFAGDEDHHAFMDILNNTRCVCGCNFTLGQCRIEDSRCEVSPPIVKRIFDSLAAKQPSFYEAALPPALTVDKISGTEGPESFDLHQAGKVPVILVFWATWCPPCKAEVPIFNKLIQKYKKTGLKVAGISIDYELTDAALAKEVKAMGSKYFNGRGSHEQQSAYFVENLPTSMLIDADGFFAYKWVGLHTEADFSKVIDKMAVP